MNGMCKISRSKRKMTNIVITHNLKKYDVESFRMDIINANWEDAIDSENKNINSVAVVGKEFLAVLDKDAPK